MSNSRPNGEAVAALLSAMFGLLTLSLAVLASELSDSTKESIFSIGKFWMPAAEGIGPYSGKETLCLFAWLGTWCIFHFMIGKREMNGEFWLFVFLLGIGVSTTLVWPPFWSLVH